MEVTVRQVNQDQKEIIRNLLQLYLYDFSEFTGVDLNPTGSYTLMPDFNDYWDKPLENRVLFIRVHNQIAGFALLKHISKDNRLYNYLSHFFVLKKYRLSGVGKRAAKSIFDSFVGEWECCQLESNMPALQFWSKVIRDYTNDNYLQRTEKGRIYQTFVSRSNDKPCY